MIRNTNPTHRQSQPSRTGVRQVIAADTQIRASIVNGLLSVFGGLRQDGETRSEIKRGGLS